MMKVNKMFFCLTMVVALVLGTTGCSSEGDGTERIPPILNNDERNYEVDSLNSYHLLGKWQLRLVTIPWSRFDNIPPNTCLCTFTDGGKLVVNNIGNVGEHSCIFELNGIYGFSATSDSITIKSNSYLRYSYHIDRNMLYIGLNADSDGPQFTFEKVK